MIGDGRPIHTSRRIRCVRALQRGLVPSATILDTLLSEGGGSSLPTLKAVLSDDDAATRLMATQVRGGLQGSCMRSASPCHT